MGEESRGLGIFAGKAQRSWSEATKKSGTILSLCMAESQGIPKTYQAAEGHFWGMDTIQLSAAMAQSNATLPELFSTIYMMSCISWCLIWQCTSATAIPLIMR